jgi:transposase
VKNNIRYVGLDVHAATIAVAVAEHEGEVRSLGIIPNNFDAVRKLVKKLGPAKPLRVCYEAGPTGYALYWQLTQLGVECVVIAPTLVPKKPGERVKTDRRDAAKLARCFRAGDLTAVWVPDREHEALRDLVRAREAAKRDQLRARHRLQKFLLRLGRRAPGEAQNWTAAYFAWVRTLTFEHRSQELTFIDYLGEVDHAAARVDRLELAINEAIPTMPARLRSVIDGLQAFRGIRTISAVTIAAEVGEFSRFAKPSQLMAYSGTVPSEHSSGETVRRSGITKTGNAHLRRILIEAAWLSRFRPNLSRELKLRQRNSSARVQEIAWKAQHRLHSRYCRLITRGKSHQVAVVALARELLGFLWAAGAEVERQYADQRIAA